MASFLRYKSSDDVILDAIIREHSQAKGSILMAHGINSDKDEEGFFVRLSEKLEVQRFNIFRFDFRCHGNSLCPSKYMTIKGETDDLSASLSLMNKRWSKPIIIVAASFGAVSVLNNAMHLPLQSVIGVVLLNPVLDLEATFLKPRFEWPRQSFNENSYACLNKIGYFRLDGKLKIGQQLFDEIHELRPYENLRHLNIPVLIIHGNADHYVSYDISKEYSETMNNCDFVTINGADHGFGKPKDERKVINTVCAWINQIDLEPRNRPLQVIDLTR